MNLAVAINHSNTVTLSSHLTHNIGRQVWSEYTAGVSAVSGVAIGSAWPSHHVSPPDPKEFRAAFQSALLAAMEATSQDEADPPDPQIWNAATTWLARYAVNVATPLLCPLQLGGLSIEWHDHGLNIEARFRNTNHVYAVIEDARAEVATFQGRDNTLARVNAALKLLAHRSR